MLATDVATVTGGFTGFVDSLLPPAEPSDDAVLAPFGAHRGSRSSVQHPVARNLLLTAREQDPAKLLEHAAALEMVLIMGDQDRHMYWQNLHAFVRDTFTRSEFRLVNGAGHAAFWEKSEEVNKEIISFVDRIVAAQDAKV